MGRAVGDTKREGQAPGRRRHGRDLGGSGVRAAAVRHGAGSAARARSVAALGGRGSGGGPAPLRLNPVRPVAHREARYRDPESRKPPAAESRQGRPGRRAGQRPRWSRSCAASLSGLEWPLLEAGGGGADGNGGPSRCPWTGRRRPPARPGGRSRSRRGGRGRGAGRPAAPSGDQLHRLPAPDRSAGQSVPTPVKERGEGREGRKERSFVSGDVRKRL